MTEVVVSVDAQYLDKDVQLYCDENGLELFRDHDDLLLLDIDNLEQEAIYRKARADTSLNITGWLETVSVHGKMHVYAKLRDTAPITQRLTWQRWLGSDPIRGYLDEQRIKQGISVADSNVLFETPEECKRVLEFLED